MGFKSFQIVFDNPWNTFYCGQTVSGRVLLKNESPLKIRGIIVQFKGEAEVRFEEETTSTDKDGQTVRHTTCYTGNETYFENKYNIVGGPSSESYLEVGELVYPFTTILPPHLPSSFEGEFGHVRYTVKVTVDIPWKFDQEAKTAFTVISPVDLNLDPAAKLPVKQTTEKHFGCWCCKSAPLSLTVSLPSSGFVSGQKIPVVIDVDNTSNQPVSHVSCKLAKMVKFHSRNPSHETRISNVTVVELSVGPVNANESGTWAEHLTVPPLPPSNLTNCSLIDLTYELRLEAHVTSCWHRNLCLTIPVHLGTIPLMENFAVQPQAPFPNQPVQYPNGSQMPGPQPGAPVAFPNQPVQYPNGSQMPGPQPGAPVGWHQPGMMYPDLPPPSFEQAIDGAKTIRDAGDSEHMQSDPGFTPRYPSYNFQPSAPPM